MTWPTKKLGEVCEKLKIEKASVGIIPYVEIGDIHIETKKINFKEKGVVKGSIFAPADCVIVSRVRPTRGAVALLDKKLAISSAFTILKPKSILDLKFLFCCLAYNPKFFEYLGKRQKGSNYPSCREKDILNFEIPLPLLKIQKRIVARIEELFEKIDKARELRQKAQEETETIFPSALQEIFSKAEKKWGKKKVAEIAKLVTKGTTPTTYGYKFTTLGIPFLRVEDIDNKEVDYKSTKLFIDKKTHKFLLRSQTQAGDVLVTIAGTIGRSAYIPEGAPQMNMNQAVALVRLDKKIAFPQYMCLTLQSDNLQKQMRGGQVTATVTNLSLTRIRNLQIPLPPLSEQKRIVVYLNNLREKVDKLKILQQQQAKELEELKKSILEKAFSGKLISEKK